MERQEGSADYVLKHELHARPHALLLFLFRQQHFKPVMQHKCDHESVGEGTAGCVERIGTTNERTSWHNSQRFHIKILPCAQQ